MRHNAPVFEEQTKAPFHNEELGECPANEGVICRAEIANRVTKLSIQAQAQV